MVALFIGSPFHECGVAAGCLDAAIVGLLRGYACRRGFRLFTSCSCRLGGDAEVIAIVRYAVGIHSDLRLPSGLGLLAGGRGLPTV